MKNNDKYKQLIMKDEQSMVNDDQPMMNDV